MKATIESTVSIKINTGNYETIDITKTVKMDIECASVEELEAKRKTLDTEVIRFTKDLAERTLVETGRERTKKIGNKETPVGIWE